MKKFLWQLLISCVVSILFYVFLDQYQVLSDGRFNYKAGSYRLLLLMGTGVTAGLAMQLSDILGLIKKKSLPQFHLEIMLGQGIPALILLFNQPVSQWLIKNDFMKEILPGMKGYPAALSLAGCIWLGLILVNTCKPNAGMFHVKQRRRVH